MKRTGLVAAAMGLALSVSACGGLSMDSAVQPGLEVGAARDDPVRVLFPGPASGSTPTQIVQGFLRAGAASDQEYEVARSFMTPAPENTWRPDGSIMIFTDESAVSVRALNQSTVQARATVVASIDGNGHYRDLPAGSVAESTFKLQQVAGEWRIASLQEGFGLWLSASDASRLYNPFRIHYISTSGRQLVPDIRWFALGKGLATRLARAQLGDVPPYLSGAARTDIPVGTRLTVDAVPVDNGLATVDLTATKPGGDPVRRQNLWAQFVATMTQVPEVSRVALKVEGTNLDLPGLTRPPATLTDLGFPIPASGPAVDPLLRTGTQVYRVDPSQLTDQKDPDPSRKPATPAIIPGGWAWLAVAKNGSEIAAVGGDRAELSRWKGSSQITVPYFGSRLTPPTYDAQNYLWVAGESAGTHLWVLNTADDSRDVRASPPKAVEAPWLDGRVVVAQRVSPDGQRVAVISTASAGADPRVEVAGVVRSANGEPQRLAVPIRVASTLTLARDLVWVDHTTLAVLGRITPSSPVRAWTAGVGGRLQAAEVADMPGARTITTTNGERGLVVTTDDGRVLLRAGSSWLAVAQGTDFAVPAT